MKTLYFVCITYFTSSFLLYADDFSGAYHGNKANWFSWGEPCTIIIKKIQHQNLTHSYEINLEQKGSHSIFPRIINSNEINQTVYEESSKNLNFSHGSRTSEGYPRQDTTLYFNQGQLTQVYLAEAYLIFPKTKYTCGRLQKRIDLQVVSEK